MSGWGGGGTKNRAKGHKSGGEDIVNDLKNHGKLNSSELNSNWFKHIYNQLDFFKACQTCENLLEHVQTCQNGIKTAILEITTC